MSFNLAIITNITIILTERLHEEQEAYNFIHNQNDGIDNVEKRKKQSRLLDVVLTIETGDLLRHQLDDKRNDMDLSKVSLLFKLHFHLPSLYI